MQKVIKQDPESSIDESNSNNESAVLTDLK